MFLLDHWATSCHGHWQHSWLHHECHCYWHPFLACLLILLCIPPCSLWPAPSSISSPESSVLLGWLVLTWGAGAQPRFQSWGSNSLIHGITTLLQKKIRQVYPVWCSRLHNHTLFVEKLCKKLGVRTSPKFVGVRPNFEEVRTPRSRSGCAHGG